MEAVQVNQLLPAANPHEDLIDEECVAVPSVFPLQSSSVYSPEFYTPQANRFPAYRDTSLSQQIFYIAMTEIESIVEPDGI